MTAIDHKEIKIFVHVPKDRFADKRLKLYNKDKNTHEYTKNFIVINKK